VQPLQTIWQVNNISAILQMIIQITLIFLLIFLESTFGQNSFSFPKSLLFNKTLSMKQSTYDYSTTDKGIKIYN